MLRKFSKLTGTALSIIMLGALAGCEGGAIMKMPDKELRAKMSECRQMRNQSSVKAQACANYKRECDRRRKERYVC